MMVVLLVAGIGLLLAGLVAIGFGIPINEFGFGNTLIQAGTVAACTGMLLLGLWTAVKELKIIARRLGPAGAAAGHRAENASQPASAGAAPPNPAENSGFYSRDQAGPENAGHIEPAAPSTASPPPWLGEAAPRERAPDDSPLAPAAAEPAPAVKPKRNLLFSSSSRKERERAQARADPSMTVPQPESAAPPQVPESPEAPPASFDDAWPKPERSRSEIPPPRRAGRTPSTFAEADPAADSADRHPPAARVEDTAQVTVLKSGVVDGMAYSLYSDGSIEAQMPEGMMRFASIDELRSHLDHRS
ncbi:DUF308 domain-containing protein [Bradyrhizobium sp.]|uniref:DUF308 domain-containing protein n=1 Tax=Bradyrhizobium sp. TaxID=376 RepID=UPI002732E955|nr:DUF308 domain-containing protein [Bradyrhizobium sp.]MDP3076185.1 DUF308 domain-containing protein [Bradyrhizobium sp.]